MKRHFMLFVAVIGLMTAAVFGGDDVRTIHWSTKALDGAAIAVPKAQTVSLVVFAMVDQERSTNAIQQIQRLVADRKNVQAVLVVSGEDAAFKAQRLAQSSVWPGAVVADPDYATSGKMQVHVWPSVVVVDGTGRVAGQIAGLPTSLTKDLDAYTRFAAGQINEEQLKAALTTHEVATDSDAQAAHRHMQVATRLMALQQFAQARDQINQGLKLEPKDLSLKLMRARLDILTGKPAEALRQLNAMSTDSGPAWRVSALRGRALAELGQWEQAKGVLEEGLKLNPQPAETYYFLGRAYEQAGDWPNAAKAYRQSFEHAPLGRQTLGK